MARTPDVQATTRTDGEGEPAAPVRTGGEKVIIGRRRRLGAETKAAAPAGGKLLKLFRFQLSEIVFT